MICGDAIVACLSDCVSGERCEIGINTDERHRRRGLAALTVAATVNHCLDNGLGLIGWHCLANNTGSRRTAEKVGFALEREYLSFSSEYPAENAGDMSRDQWLEWADYYAAASQKQAMFRYGEAECQAQAGDAEQVLDVLYGILQDGMEIPRDWLNQHWTFASLRKADSWNKLIEQLAP
jgi:hypothetical protein